MARSFERKKFVRPESVSVKGFALFLLVICVVGTGSAQGNGPERDATALSILANSISAMGGANGWGNIQDWTITGSVSTSGSGQQAAFSWIGAGPEFRIEVDPGENINLFLSGHGSPARISNGNVHFNR
jgi:hypothetical protein